MDQKHNSLRTQYNKFMRLRALFHRIKNSNFFPDRLGQETDDGYQILQTGCRDRVFKTCYPAEIVGGELQKNWKRSIGLQHRLLICGLWIGLESFISNALPITAKTCCGNRQDPDVFQKVGTDSGLFTKQIILNFVQAIFKLNKVT